MTLLGVSVMASVMAGCLGQLDPLQPLASTESTSSNTSESSTGPAAGPTCEKPQLQCNAVDVLFIIDNSGSMSDDFNDLTLDLISEEESRIESLFRTIADSVCSYHIGVTSTTPAPDYQPSDCQIRGALSRGTTNPIPPATPTIWDEDHPPWISEEDEESQAISDLTSLFFVGEKNEDDERQLDTLLASIGPDLIEPGGCNEGFLRDGVPLLVVLVTDEDDDDDRGKPGEEPDRVGSEGDPEEWLVYLNARKPLEEIAMVVIAPTGESDCGGWQPDDDPWDGAGAEPAVRIRQFVDLLALSGAGHAEMVDLCQDPNFGDLLFDQFTKAPGVISAACPG
ncbi:MAG: hypothetical protein AAGF11_50670 [Myxococcota bacterium]